MAWSLLKNGGAETTAGQTGHLEQQVFQGGIFTGIGLIINSVLSLVGVIFLILMFYGGYLWMTAQGNESQVEKAKGILTTAIIGLIITFSSFAISTLIISYFGKESLQ
jgi:TRAP-type C4-dicarboxylate transport system permease small subunit